MKTAPRIADRSDGRDNNFNLIRMLAASGVLVSHSYPLTIGAGAIQPFESSLHGLSLGTICVWIFFAISGFFITRSYDRKRSARSFLEARVLRVLPGLAVMTAITIIVAGFFLTQAPPSVFWAAADGYFISSLLLFKLQYTLPGVFQGNPFGPSINGSLWSLSYEITCYAGVLLGGLLGVFGRKQLFAGIVVLFLGLYVVAMIADLHPRIEQMTRLGLPFLTGMVFYIWRHHIPLSWSVLAGLAILTLAAWFTPLFFPVFAVTLSYAIFVLGYMGTPPLHRYNTFGDYSYGVYIYAYPIQQLVVQAGVLTPITNIAIALPLTVICAILSWHLVEHPAMKWRQNTHRRYPLKTGRPTE